MRNQESVLYNFLFLSFLVTRILPLKMNKCKIWIQILTLAYIMQCLHQPSYNHGDISFIILIISDLMIKFSICFLMKVVYIYLYSIII